MSDLVDALQIEIYYILQPLTSFVLGASIGSPVIGLYAVDVKSTGMCEKHL